MKVHVTAHDLRLHVLLPNYGINPNQQSLNLENFIEEPGQVMKQMNKLLLANNWPRHSDHRFT